MRKNSQKLGPLAQSVEQRTFNPWVVGSIPTGPTNTFFSYTANALLEVGRIEQFYLVSQCTYRDSVRSLNSQDLIKWLDLLEFQLSQVF
jgi:hypothetical protein